MASEPGRGGDPPRDKPITIYDARAARAKRPRWKRIVLWTLATLLVAVLAVGGAVGLWAREQLDKLGHLTKDVVAAQHGLGQVPSASQPAVALVIGSDYRTSYGPNGPSRSDTLMLVRVDPATKLISLLSLPRDLWVPINGACCQKINSAFSEGGPKLTVNTVKALTGVNPNYLVTVDFGGFIQLVNEIGGVYVMVDQHYYHVNTPGTDQYSQIDIPPGYQLLDGINALAFSRYRHTDSDFYRNARQQVFLRAFEQAASRKFHGLGLDQLTALRDVVETITSNVQVTGQSGVPGVETMIRYLALAYKIKGRVVTVKLDATTAGDATNSYVTATPEAIRTAVYQWEHPQELWHPGAIPGAGGKPAPPPWTPAVTPSTVQVTVLNGNGRTGSAGQAASALHAWGYQAASSTTPAPTFTYKENWIYYRPGHKPAADDLARIMGNAQSAPMPATQPFSALTTPIVVVVGSPFQGKLAIASPPPPPSTGPPASIRLDPTTYQAYFAQAQRTLHFPVLYPTVSQAESSFDPYQPDQPVRTYTIAEAGRHTNSMYAYWAMPNLAGAFWGIEETRFTGAPILSNPDAVRTIGGRKLQFYLDGSQIHLIAYVHHGIAYWLTNTLRDDLTNAEMIAIAKSLRPVP